jgi:rhodanese-related sulfurtransferase
MEDLVESASVKYYTSADLITYFETHGDYINSENNSAIISVDEVYNNLSKYLLMDIRTETQFQSGHIDGARNFGIEELLDSLQFNSVNMDAEIIIISESGQKAAYATALLRLYGYTNIFSLNFGMAHWNEKFADVWIDARNDSEWKFTYTEQYYPKPKKGNELPNINGYENVNTTEELVKLRIKNFLNKAEYQNAIATIQEADATYSLRYSKFVDGFMFCYADRELYEIVRHFKNVTPPLTWGGHPRSAVFYDGQTDFKASSNLLTLPANKTIYNYTFNGQRSLYITVYLRLIGTMPNLLDLEPLA